ncbi:MAG: protoporphyrinogen oxidase [Planctomycetota bacterium]
MTDATSEAPLRVAVIGGGLTGLAATLRLAERLPAAELTLFESSNRVGGVLETVERDGFLIERSADNFLTKEPWALDFCRQLGLEDELLPTNEERRRALVVRAGRVVPAPEAFVLMAPKRLGPLMRSPVLSPWGKLRLACEPLVPRRNGSAASTVDESVASFARRRLGREAFERLVQPLLAGIYTADPERLSMAATMPQFVEQERTHGSLLRASLAEQKRQRQAQREDPSHRESGARYGLFRAPKRGMQQLIDSAERALPGGCVRFGQRVQSVRREQGKWIVDTGEESSGYDAAIVTTPAHAAAGLLKEASGDLERELAAIEYAGCSVVCLGFRQEQLPSLPTGFGFVVPSIEGRQIIAASFSSLKFPGRAPGDGLLVRVFVGGALQPGLAELADEELTRIARSELSELVGVRGEQVLSEIARWPRAMPQYHVGHLDRVDRIERLVAGLPGLEVAGAAYRGVGMPQCIRDGQQAADRIAEHAKSLGAAG